MIWDYLAWIRVPTNLDGLGYRLDGFRQLLLEPTLEVLKHAGNYCEVGDASCQNYVK